MKSNDASGAASPLCIYDCLLTAFFSSEVSLEHLKCDREDCDSFFSNYFSALQLLKKYELISNSPNTFFNL